MDPPVVRTLAAGWTGSAATARQQRRGQESWNYQDMLYNRFPGRLK
jgi:hypothetical protein